MRSPPTRLSRRWRLLSRYARTPALSLPLGPWTSDDSASFLILPASPPWPEPVDDPRIVKGVQFSSAGLIVVTPTGSAFVETRDLREDRASARIELCAGVPRVARGPRLVAR